MRYRDIEQLTPPGSYQVNMSLGYLEKWIQEQISELGLQLNPDFQRGHVWTEEQQRAYVEFLFRGGKSSRVIYFNHPGWMNDFDAHPGYKDYVCVDGLQRLTAVRKFVNNELKVFGHYADEFEDKIPLDVDLLVNINNIQTKAGVLKWYLEMNSGGTPHSDSEIARVRAMLEAEQGT